MACENAELISNQNLCITNTKQVTCDNTVWVEGVFSTNRELKSLNQQGKKDWLAFPPLHTSFLRMSQNLFPQDIQSVNNYSSKKVSAVFKHYFKSLHQRGIWNGKTVGEESRFDKLGINERNVQVGHQPGTKKAKILVLFQKCQLSSVGRQNEE